MNETQELQEALHQAVEHFHPLNSEDWKKKPAPLSWSKQEILGHLIDSARYNLQRFTEIQFSKAPYAIKPYSPDQLVAANAYQKADVQQLVLLWKALNDQILHLTEQQPPEALALPLKYDEGNLSSFGELWTDYVQHLKHHLHQILN